MFLIIIGGRCPGVICHGGNYPRRKLSSCNYLWAIFLGGNCTGVNCPGGDCLGDNCLTWELSGGGLVLSDNYPEENCLGDNFLEGIVPFLFLNANFAMKNSELKDQFFWGLARITVTFCISCICL